MRQAVIDEIRERQRLYEWSDADISRVWSGSFYASKVELGIAVRPFKAALAAPFEAMLDWLNNKLKRKEG